VGVVPEIRLGAERNECTEVHDVGVGGTRYRVGGPVLALTLVAFKMSKSGLG